MISSVGVFSDGAADPLYYVFLVTFALVPVRSSPESCAASSRGRVSAMSSSHSRGTPIRDAIAQTLGDLTLEIAYWLPESGRYVSADGKPLVEDTDTVP